MESRGLYSSIAWSIKNYVNALSKEGKGLDVNIIARLGYKIKLDSCISIEIHEFDFANKASISLIFNSDFIELERAFGTALLVKIGGHLIVDIDDKELSISHYS
jgi:hypothetical protein